MQSVVGLRRNLRNIDATVLAQVPSATLGSEGRANACLHSGGSTVEEKNLVLPYTIGIPEERLAAIMAKVEAYDWSQLPDAGGWKSGVAIDDLKRFVVYPRDV